MGQAGTLVREVLDDEARDRLAHNIIGHVSKGVREPVLSRVFEYWRNVDPDLGGKKVEEGVRGGADGHTNVRFLTPCPGGSVRDRTFGGDRPLLWRSCRLA